MKFWKKQEHGSTHPRPSISLFTVHHRGCLSGAAATDHHHTASFSLMPASLSLLTGGASPPPVLMELAATSSRLSLSPASLTYTSGKLEKIAVAEMISAEMILPKVDFRNNPTTVLGL